MGLFSFLKRKKPQKQSRKTSAFIYSSGGTTAFPDQDYQKQIQEVWKNVVSFRCIDKIAQACSSVPWRFEITTGDKIQVINDSNYNRLIKRPNPFESWSVLIYKTIAYLLCNGNSYPRRITVMTGKEKLFPKELYVMMPHLMVAKLDDDGNIQKYVYEENKAGKANPEFPVDFKTGQCDILHLKEFHPLDEVYGYARTQSASYEIDTSNMATLWNYKILKNEAKIGMLYFINGIIDQQTYEFIEKKIAEFEGAGAEKAGKSLILGSEGGADAKPYSMTPKDIDFLEGAREVARKIAFGYGVPARLIGIPGDSTYNNEREARLAFWEETVLYYLNYFRESFNAWVFPDSNVQINYTLDDVPVFVEKKIERMEKVDKISSITINEKRKMMGFDVIEGGDVLYVPGNLLPLGEEPQNLPEQQTQTDENLEEQGFDENIRKIARVGW